MIGIYRIRNIINEKCYYGSSKNIEKRWKQHKNKLISKKHENCVLQQAWNKYGEDKFIFEIIEECSITELLDFEQMYLNLNPAYNIGLKASGGDNLSKHPNRNNIIKKITTSVKTRNDKLTPEERKDKWSMPMDKNPNWSGGTSYVYCKCGKRIGYGNINCNKCTPKSGENNPFYNKKHSEETKQHLSDIRKGKYNGGQNIPILIDDLVYSSLGEASKKLGLPFTVIRWRILSKNPKFSNYRYEHIEKISFSLEENYERHSKPHRNSKRNHNKPFTIDGIKYRTLEEANRLLAIHQMTIKGRLLSKSEKFNNYKYID